MLQTKISQPSIIQEPSASEFVSLTQLIEYAISFARRQYIPIGFVTVLVMALGLIYLFTTPPSYTAQARLIIDTKKGQLFQQQSIIADIPIDSAAVESQVEVLRSDTVAQSVIRDLRLTEDPEFVATGGGLIGTVVSFFSTAVSEPVSEYDLTRRATGSFAGRLDVRRVGLTYVIEIGFRSLSPDRAAQVVNAVADAYVVDQLDAKYQATRRASIWLQERMRELRDQASTAERAVVAFKTKNNIVDTGGGRLVNEQQVAELNTQLVIARTQISEARARLDRIQAVLRADSPDATVDSTVADTLNSQVVIKLRSQYLDLASREADWSTRYGRTHLAAINLRNQMREIRNSILDELRRLAESYKSDFEIAKQRQEGIEKELAESVSQSQETNQIKVSLRDLESTAQSYRSLYDNFLQRYMESVQQQSFPITEARLISSASKPTSKSSPKPLLVLALSTVLGTILGIGVGLTREMSDRVFRTANQIETLLNADCLAVLPLVKRDKARAAIVSQKAKVSHPAAPRMILPNENAMSTVVDQPLSRYAEEMRSLKLAVDLSGAIKSNKVIGFTSSVPNEGKSTIANSFAQLIGQTGGKVILVDCDFRNPSLSRLLAPSATAGILDVATGRASLEDVTWKDPMTGMVFLPAVFKSRVVHSNEILGSDPIKKLFEQLRGQYDYVIADFSPIVPVVDVRATGHLVDSYVFVIEWGKTRIGVVEQALSVAKGVNENLLGVVLNKTNISSLGSYGGQSRSYYYNKQYSRYGYTD